MGKEQTGHYQYYPFMNLGHFMLYEFADPELQRVLADIIAKASKRCIAAGGKNPYRVGVPFIWCSNNLLVALVTQCALYERMTGDRRYQRVHVPATRLAAGPQSVGHLDVHRHSRKAEFIRITRT